MITRKLIFLLVFCLQAANASQGQITIVSTDFANPNDTVRTSLSANVSSFDFQSTGTNHTWNFANLPVETQRLDTFYSIKQVPPVFLLSFFSVANLASKLGALQLLPGIDIINAWQFVNKGISNYRDWGYGLIVQDFPLPLRFTTPDLLYNFPLSYNMSYGSNAYLEYPLTGVGYISISRNRQNLVDGWGTLTTPYGTFQTLRVKSTVRESDSIYIDSIGQGIRINRSYVEYKWLAKNQKIPLLTATVDSALGTFVVYKDFYRPQTVVLPEQTVQTASSFPQPFDNECFYQFCTTEPNHIRLGLYNIQGKLVYISFEQSLQGCHTKSFKWPLSMQNEQGLFFLVVSDGKHQQTFKLLRKKR